MLWLPVTSDAAAFHWLFQLTFEVQFSDRYVSPGMLPLAAQPAAHCSTTRIRCLGGEAGELPAAVAAAVHAEPGFEQEPIAHR